MMLKIERFFLMCVQWKEMEEGREDKVSRTLLNGYEEYGSFLVLQSTEAPSSI